MKVAVVQLARVPHVGPAEDCHLLDVGVIVRSWVVRFGLVDDQRETELEA